VRGRSPDFRVITRVHLPEARSLSGISDVRSPVTVAGAAAAYTAFPFESLEGNLAPISTRPSIPMVKSARNSDAL
jgi:hypothetical protein